MSSLNQNDPYLDTIGRMEPEIASVDIGAGWASTSISQCRIANSLESIEDILRKNRAQIDLLVMAGTIDCSCIIVLTIMLILVLFHVV